MDNLKRFLQEHQFFQGLGDDYLELLAGCALNTRFKANEYVCREGEESNMFYIIRDGLIAIQIPIQSGHALTIKNIEKNDIIGWSWLFPPHYWRFNAVAKKETRAIALDGECLRLKCDSNHELGYELSKRFAKVIETRLEATRLQLVDVIINTTKIKNKEEVLQI